VALVVVALAGGGAALAVTRPWALRDAGTASGGGAPAGNGLPVIEKVELTPSGADLYWRDEARPGTPHVLVTYSVSSPQHHDLVRSPQALAFSGRPKFCFVVTQTDDATRRSPPVCINDADPEQLVRGP
jgi:hypothetical protein